MAITADKVVVELSAKIDRYNADVAAATAKFDRAMAGIRRSALGTESQVTRSAGAMGSALKGFVAAFTVDRIVRGLAAANADLVRIGETAKRVGLDLHRFQELQFAGRQSGLTGKDFGSGLEGLAEKLNEARQKENDLSKLFADNNIALKNRKGEVVGINEALSHAANLVRNAATEFDKIKIAEALGLTKDWVPLLEQGADAINKQASAARDAGAVIDSSIIQKAKDFERDWATAIERWATIFKANAGGIIQLIDSIIGKASGLLGMVSEYARKTAAAEDIRQNSVAGASRDSLEYVAEVGRREGRDPVNEVQKRLEEFRELDREGNRGRRSEPLNVTVSGRGTNTSSLFPKDKTPKGPKSEEEKAQQSLDRYIESLMRQNSVLDAEIETFGKSNAEKRAAVELAKAQVDLQKLDEPARQKVIEGLKREIELSEQKRVQLQKLKEAQDGLRDAQKYFGDAAVDALEDLIINGENAEKVVQNLAKSLAKAALQAALMGSGPLAGLFGTAGSNGATGGLFGALFNSIGGKADGGWITGPGSGRSDSVLARLSNGEHVTNARSAAKYAPLLDAINRDRLPKFASGGFVGMPALSAPKIPSTPAGAPNSRGGSMAIAVTVNGARGNSEIEAMVNSGVSQALRAYDAKFDRRLGVARNESARRSGVY